MQMCKSLKESVRAATLPPKNILKVWDIMEHGPKKIWDNYGASKKIWDIKKKYGTTMGHS